MKKIKVNVNSEIGTLDAVLLHSPGPEVENMIPENAERALYSDILNLSEVKKEYLEFQEILGKHTQMVFIKDLLEDILKNETIKNEILNDIFKFEKVTEDFDYLLSLNAGNLAKQLIEGVVMRRNSLTKFFSQDRYSLPPLHNFFFTRDAASSIGNKVLINRMARKIRERESLIMESILNHHPMIDAETMNPMRSIEMVPGLTTEGGDILVINEDILLLGMSLRTSSLGIDYIINRFKSYPGKKHMIVQELPKSPESFIHLDMAFTCLDQENCMIYEPVIQSAKQFQTIHITIDNGKVEIRTEDDIMSALKKLGMDLNPVICGGKNDIWIQKREQWHSGTNFFAMAPGKLIGYGRNEYTLEQLNNAGYEILTAKDVINENIDLTAYQKYIVTIHGTELARGGGGARCMTMPLARQKVDW